MILKKDEKERLVIKLAMQGLTTREIAKAAHVSLKDIGTIIRKHNGASEYSNKNPSITSKAFEMFEDGKDKVKVAIDLNLESYEVVNLFHDYLQLLNLDRLVTTHQYLGANLTLFLDLFDKMRDEGIITQPAIARLVHSAGKLIDLKDECFKVCDQIGRLNNKKSELKKRLKKQLPFCITCVTYAQSLKKKYSIKKESLSLGSKYLYIILVWILIIKRATAPPPQRGANMNN